MRSRTAQRVRLHWWSLVALLASVVLLAGCVRVEIAITLNDDGSGEISLLSAVDAETLTAFAEESGAEVENPLADLDEADFPPGTSVEEYDEDGFTGVRATFPFEAGDDVAEAIDAVLADAGDDSEGLTGPEGLFESFALRRDGDAWRFDAVVPPLDEELALDLGAGSGGLTGEGGDAFGGALAELLFAEATFTIRLELPGEIVEHNADEIDGNTLVWNLNLFSGEPRELMALTGSGGGGGVSAMATAVIVIALLIAVGAAIVWLMSRRRGAAGA